MQSSDPFSFNGRMGRAQFWLTMIVGSSLAAALDAFPVKSHRWMLSTFGGFGESYIDYATPSEPVTVQSWVVLAAFYLLMAALYWVFFAAMVQRLHDLGRSGKWVPAVVGALLTIQAVEAVFSRPGQPITILEVAELIFMAPFCFIGAFGMLAMMFVPCASPSHTDGLDASDMRN